MIRRTERQVFAYDLVVKARAKHAEPPTMVEIAEAWKSIYKHEDSSHARDNKTIILRIGDIDIDPKEQLLKMLIRRCDVNASNAVYSNKRTGASRVAIKNDDEGGDKAAHLIVSLRPQSGCQCIYLGHLEGVPGLSHRLIQATLNALLKLAIEKKAVEFKFPSPNGARDKSGNIKTREFIPHVEIQGHLSPELISDIENGKVSHVYLMNNNVSGQLGSSQYLDPKQSILKMNVSGNIPSSNRFGTILDAIFPKRFEYQKARIAFADPQGQSRSIECDIDTGTPEQQHYIKSYLIRNINPPMDESSPDLVPFLTNEIAKRLLQDRA